MIEISRKGKESLIERGAPSGQNRQHPRRVAVDQVQQHQRRALWVAVANFPNDVWLYDQGSSRGTRLDGNAVQVRAFLDGAHRAMVGRNKVEVGARADLRVQAGLKGTRRALWD